MVSRYNIFTPWEDRSYLFCINDLFDKSIVSYSVSKNMNVNFVTKCLEKAIIDNNISENSLTIHSDQGIHFSYSTYISILKTYNLIRSHSRRGNFLDNSPIESFFSLFKKVALWLEKYMIYYNQQRYQVWLNEKDTTRN